MPRRRAGRDLGRPRRAASAPSSTSWAGWPLGCGDRVKDVEEVDGPVPACLVLGHGVPLDVSSRELTCGERTAPNGGDTAEGLVGGLRRLNKADAQGSYESANPPARGQSGRHRRHTTKLVSTSSSLDRTRALAKAQRHERATLRSTRHGSRTLQLAEFEPRQNRPWLHCGVISAAAIPRPPAQVWSVGWDDRQPTVRPIQPPGRDDLAHGRPRRRCRLAKSCAPIRAIDLAGHREECRSRTSCATIALVILAWRRTS